MVRRCECCDCDGFATRYMGAVEAFVCRGCVTKLPMWRITAAVSELRRILATERALRRHRNKKKARRRRKR